MTSRDVTDLAERADDAVRAYADALWKWNAPDDEHTRIQLRRLVEDVIEDGPIRVTCGRPACAREDWSRCGMHGPECPPEYAPFPRGSV